jgi:hypothetical protein
MTHGRKETVWGRNRAPAVTTKRKSQVSFTALEGNETACRRMKTRRWNEEEERGPTSAWGGGN